MTFLPITADEVKHLGWEMVDIVLVSGDAYIDHPSFGTAVIGRVLEHAGYRVAIIPQPNVPKSYEWSEVCKMPRPTFGEKELTTLRDFQKFGAPRLFFGVTSGVMDSMVNHYTAARRRRSDDAYTPGGTAGYRPDYATYVYSLILKSLYPNTPVIIGGVEASMRRLAHYDYWSDSLRPSILNECPADMMIYGMAERTILKVAQLMDSGASLEELHQLPQIAYRANHEEVLAQPLPSDTIHLHSYNECLTSKRLHAENYGIIERESNKITPATLIQDNIVVNPPEAPMTSKEIDASFDLPYTRLPHPKYKKRGTIPAYEMIKHSINSHRGCFGGCAFCTISAHQGKHIASRSETSIIKEVEQVVAQEDFHGTLTDLGGPSANMYGMHGKDLSRCSRCSRYSCIQPSICDNLLDDHQPIIDLYRKISSIPGVKHLYIGSGIRCDMFTDKNHGWQYFEEVVRHHVSGRLKVAPEHSSPQVLKLMRKPSFKGFIETKQRFDDICRRAGLRYQLIPYFISSHPGCRLSDMAELAVTMKRMGYRLEQVQDFTPTPMTLATEMYYTGLNPATLEPVYVARHPNEKREQRRMFFYYKDEEKGEIRKALQNAHLGKYIKELGV